MELTLNELILKILNDTIIRSVVLKVQTVAPVAGSLLVQRKGSGQYNIAVADIDMDKVQATVDYFARTVGVLPGAIELPKQLLKKFDLPIVGIALPSAKINIDYDVMLSMYWNGPFGHFVFTRQISNDDKQDMQRVSDLFHDQLHSDGLLRDVVIK